MAASVTHAELTFWPGERRGYNLPTPGFLCPVDLYIFAPSVGSRRLISIVRSLEKEFRA
ncbi:MAG: hypothetical protein JSS27_19030 [Planctomycetes bacterium]|nr:hypothetical protein [Planctomycetota bacterium]